VEEPAELGDDAFEIRVVLVFRVAALALVREVHLVLCPEQYDVQLLPGDRAYRGLYVYAVADGDLPYLVQSPSALHQPLVAGDGAVHYGFGFVRDDEVGVELHLESESVALRARAERGVEGKVPRLDFP